MDRQGNDRQIETGVKRVRERHFAAAFVVVNKKRRIKNSGLVYLAILQLRFKVRQSQFTAIATTN